MTAIDPVAPAAVAALRLDAASGASTRGQGFGDLLVNGLHQMQARVAHADAMVAAFATDDSVPVHQVTIALEQARLSVELAMQVRTKLVDAFHEIMTMQL